MLHETDLSRVDLNLMVLFEAVLGERHVGRAAKRLHLSPSAVSHGLGRLRNLLRDPVFLRTPKGVVPTARALELAQPIGQLLAAARSVVATAAPFDPRSSSREFTIGAPDGISTSLLLPLLARLRREGPGVDIRLRQVLPPEGDRIGEAAWEPVLAQLDARTLDVAIAPFGEVPARFAATKLRTEDFVIVSRPGHPFARKPGLPSYCAAKHLVVSLTGDARGFVDRALAERGLARRVALTVPGFFLALSLVARSDLVAAVPRSLASDHARLAGVVVTESPLPLPRFEISMVVPRVALADSGLAWLNAALRDAAASGGEHPGRRTRGPGRR
jgi:DNA-binding transcriptional LysR family regulator